MGTMPFDWMKITNVEKLVAILDNDFAGFSTFSKYEVKSQNSIFDNFDVNEGITIKSLNKLTHREYGFTLPHEYMGDIIQVPEFEEKYSRRIERFRKIVKDANIKIILVRLGNTKEGKKQCILEDALVRYGCMNYEVRFINMDNYVGNIPNDVEFDWHREYIPWQALLNNH